MTTTATTACIAPLEIMQIPPGCILPNPDIAGIGVRVAIYVQNFIAPALAIMALRNGEVKGKALDLVEGMSMSILLMACALLASAFVQVKTAGMSTYHGLIILNLAWMNNTNTFIYAILFRYQGVVPLTYFENRVRTLPPPRKAAPLLVGSLHLSAVAAFGLWFWAKIDAFGTAAEGMPPPPTFFRILGRDIPTTSKALRSISLTMYAAIAIPILNVTILLAMFYKSGDLLLRYFHRGRLFIPGYAGVIILVGINIVMVIDTETMIKGMAVFVQPGESNWTFGQTLALFMLTLPFREIVASREKMAHAGSNNIPDDEDDDREDIDSLGDLLQYIFQVLARVNPLSKLIS